MPERDLLIEIGTEELPPKALPGLIAAFRDGVDAGFREARLAFSSITPFATPRRLALRVESLATRQPDSFMEKLGPAVQAAFDGDGQPTGAALGFARSCGVSVAELDRVDDGKTSRLRFRAPRPGAASRDLIPGIVTGALTQLPIPRRMRWGSSREEFVRPVHWTVLLFGDEVIPAAVLGMEAGRITYGHRFHHPRAIELKAPADYEAVLTQAFVIPGFDQRREKIRALVTAEGEKLDARAVIADDLLDEVTALVEWPVALTGHFDPAFLDVPREALISSMKEHLKCFYLLDTSDTLLPHFIAVSNLESRDPRQVIQGFERVIRPRLADAAFFYDQDRKQSLARRREKLKTVIFQRQLGSLFDKSERVAALSAWLAEALGADRDLSARAAELGKCDLVTSMVYEFPELQGIMGYYYALHDGEPEAVALALKEQYLPRFAGDAVPGPGPGTVLALAEKFDTLTGLFGIGQPPTGSRDPFALRRAALGVLRILIENRLDLDLPSCLAQSVKGYAALPESEGLEQAVADFIFERLRAWYAEQDVAADTFQAVDAVRPAGPFEFHLRLMAVDRFRRLPEAGALAEANKRVANILTGEDRPPSATVDGNLLAEPAEIALAGALEKNTEALEPLFKRREYTRVLETLAALRDDVNRFFDEVLVNTEDAALRHNRHALLRRLRGLFLRVADISHLQMP